MLRQYRDINISPARMRVVEQAQAIADEYLALGFDLTLRQLYYQFVARGLIANRQQEYDKLGVILNDARLAGEFPWDVLVDRTREEQGGDGSEESPQEALRWAADHYTVPLWEGQPTRVEVWVEKEALAGVVEQAAAGLRAVTFACRGYVSASAMWQAAQRIGGYLDDERVEQVVLLHLGDHDPSGVDMTRDITDRLEEFLAGDGYDPGQLEVRRIALNMDQVRRYNPPPNPAKMSDSRSGDYVARYGWSSWELDALDPTTLVQLIQEQVREVIEPESWNARIALQRRRQASMRAVAMAYTEREEEPSDEA